MLKLLWNRVGRHAATAAVGGRFADGRFDIKLGFALLRDRRLAIWPKLLALAVGGALAALLIAFEISPEGILAVLLPGLGLALDFVTDGLEAVILPVLIGALVLPFVAPRNIVDTIMAERQGKSLPAVPQAGSP